MAMPRTSFAPGRARHVHHLTGTSIDAIELLESDHRHVEAWFADFDSATTMARRQTLAERICRALRIHMRIEEEIFYPAFLEAVGDRTAARGGRGGARAGPRRHRRHRSLRCR